MSARSEVLYSIGRTIARVVPLVSLVVAAVGAWIMVGLIVAEVFARDLLSYSIPFAIEYAGYLVPAVGACGAAYCLSKDRHVRINLVLSRLPDRLRQRLLIFGLAAGLVFVILFAIKVLEMTIRSFQTGILSFYPTETPLGYPQLILTIGLLLFALQLVIEIVKKVRLL